MAGVQGRKTGRYGLAHPLSDFVVILNGARWFTTGIPYPYY